MPTSGTVFVIPGITNTQLFLQPTLPTGNLPLWPPGYNPASLPALKLLQLAPAAQTPAFPLPGTVIANLWLDNTYAMMANTVPSAYDVVRVYLDWRLDLNTQATTLNNQMIQGGYRKPYYFLGHSMGGLVARLAWQLWNTQNPGNTDIARVITVATPHWGSYAVMQALAHLNVYFGMVRSFVQNGPGGAPIRALQSQVDAIIGSWPSIYELLPNPARPTGPADPAASRIFQSTSYGQFNKSVQQYWLTQANTLCATFAQAGTQPTWPVLCPILGSGFPTIATGTAKGGLNVETNYGSTDGDGVVTADSAQLGKAFDAFYADHSGICNCSNFLAKLPGYLANGLSSATAQNYYPADNTGGGVQQPYGPGIKPDVIPNAPPMQGEQQGPNIVQVPPAVAAPLMGTPGCPGQVMQVGP